jgi:hypothetical protein
MVNSDQFEQTAFPDDASVAAFIVERLNIRPMLRPFVTQDLVGNLLDSLFVYMDLIPPQEQYADLQTRIRDILNR